MKKTTRAFVIALTCAALLLARYIPRTPDGSPDAVRRRLNGLFDAEEADIPRVARVISAPDGSFVFRAADGDAFVTERARIVFSGTVNGAGEIDTFTIQAAPAGGDRQGYVEDGRLAADAVARAMMTELTRDEERALSLFFLYDVDLPGESGAETVANGTVVACAARATPEGMMIDIRLLENATPAQIEAARRDDERNRLLLQAERERDGIADCAEALCDANAFDGTEAEAVLAQIAERIRAIKEMPLNAYAETRERFARLIRMADTCDLYARIMRLAVARGDASACVRYAALLKTLARRAI